MRKLVRLWFLIGVAAAGCGERGGAPDSPQTGPLTPIGTPKPAFLGSTPAQAVQVEGEIGRYGGRVVLSIAGMPASLNPITENDVTSGSLNTLVYGRCLEFNNDKQRFEPALCERFERSEDGLTPGHFQQKFI